MIELKPGIWRYSATSTIPVWETVYSGTINWSNVRCPVCRDFLTEGFFGILYSNSNKYYYNKHKCKNLHSREHPILRAYGNE